MYLYSQQRIICSVIWNKSGQNRLSSTDTISMDMMQHRGMDLLLPLPDVWDYCVACRSQYERLERQPECPQASLPQQKHFLIDMSADLAGADQISSKEESSPLRAEDAIALRLSSAKYLLQQIRMVCLAVPRHLDNAREKL